MMKRLHLPKKWLFLSLNILLCLLALGVWLWGTGVRNALPTLDAAQTWAGESGENFAQIACYLPADAPVEESAVMQFRQKVSQKLTEASITAPDGGTLFTDAYCGEASITVQGDKGSASVKATGVGGDFFRFHPLRLRSGSYLAESDLMKDRVILDEALAWKLFGGMDLTGMSVTINGESYYVAGVVAREDDKYTAAAYSADEGGIFVSFDALKKWDEKAGVTCYEVVLPNPISSFGYNLVKDNFSVGQGVLVENSSRYSVSNLISVIRSFGKRSMGVNGIIYPYWENAVRLTEDYAALSLLLTALLLLCPVVSGVIFCIRGIIRLYRRGKTLAVEKTEALIDRHNEKVWEKTYGKKE